MVILQKSQRQILIVGIVLFVLIGLFPPWVRTLSRPGAPKAYMSVHHKFILAPPGYDSSYNGVQVDVTRLVVEWLTIVVITGAWVMLSAKLSARPSSE